MAGPGQVCQAGAKLPSQTGILAGTDPQCPFRILKQGRPGKVSTADYCRLVVTMVKHVTLGMKTLLVHDFDVEVGNFH